MVEKDPRLPIIPIDLAIICNPRVFNQHFSGKYTAIQNLLLDNIVGVDNIYRGVDSSTRTTIIGDIEHFFAEGDGAGRDIQLAAYKPFAFAQGFTRTTKWGDAVIAISELGEQQQAEWEKYLDSINFITQKRELVVGATRAMLFPTVSIKYKSANVPLAAALEEAKRQIVRELIPHISDEEAILALGARYTAAIVRSPVLLEWFT